MHATNTTSSIEQWQNKTSAEGTPNTQPQHSLHLKIILKNSANWKETQREGRQELSCAALKKPKNTFKKFCVRVQKYV